MQQPAWDGDEPLDQHDALALAAAVADVELQLDDACVPAASQLLCLHSAVLRAALACGSDSGGSSSGLRLPLPGTSKDDWALLASFVTYPVVPSAQLSWHNAERVLALAHKFDMTLLLDKASAFLAANAHELPADAAAPQSGRAAPGSVWQWLHRADAAGLPDAVAALAARAVAADRAGCGRGDNLAGLSAAALRQLVAALAGGPAPRTEQFCGRCIDHREHRLTYNCIGCGHASTAVPARRRP